MKVILCLLALIVRASTAQGDPIEDQEKKLIHEIEYRCMNADMVSGEIEKPNSLSSLINGLKKEHLIQLAHLSRYWSGKADIELAPVFTSMKDWWAISQAIYGSSDSGSTDVLNAKLNIYIAYFYDHRLEIRATLESALKSPPENLSKTK